MLLLITCGGISDTNQRGGDFLKFPGNLGSCPLHLLYDILASSLPGRLGIPLPWPPSRLTLPTLSLHRLALQPVTTSFLPPQPLLMEIAKSPAPSSLFSDLWGPHSLLPGDWLLPNFVSHHSPAPPCPGLAVPALKSSRSGGSYEPCTCPTRLPRLGARCAFCLETHPHCTPSCPSRKVLFKYHLISEAVLLTQPPGIPQTLLVSPATFYPNTFFSLSLANKRSDVKQV